MNKIAVIKTGGKQYLVREGQELNVEKLDMQPGASLEFEALLVSTTEGANTTVGTPTVGGASVKATVLESGLLKKVSIIKFKSKSRYRRNVGHRQPFTRIKIEQIAA